MSAARSVLTSPACSPNFLIADWGPFARLGLHGVKKITIEDGGLLAGEDLALEDDFANVEPIAQKMGERAAGEWDPSDRAPGLERSHLGDDSTFAKVGHQAVEAAEPEIAAKDGANPLGLLLNHDDLAVLGGVSQWCDTADPETLALGGGDLVANALRGDFPLELGKRQQDIEGQPPHRVCRIELLGDRYERHPVAVEQLHELGEVRQRAGQAVDLVNDNDIDLARPDVSQ